MFPAPPATETAMSEAMTMSLVLASVVRDPAPVTAPVLVLRSPVLPEKSMFPAPPATETALPEAMTMSPPSAWVLVADWHPGTGRERHSRDRVTFLRCFWPHPRRRRPARSRGRPWKGGPQPPSGTKDRAHGFSPLTGTPCPVGGHPVVSHDAGYGGGGGGNIIRPFPPPQPSAPGDPQLFPKGPPGGRGEGTPGPYIPALVGLRPAGAYPAQPEGFVPDQKTLRASGSERSPHGSGHLRRGGGPAVALPPRQQGRAGREPLNPPRGMPGL